MAGTRDDLTAALVRIVAERGLDAVSVRQVAAAGGVSVGTVQHHFPTKQAMLLAALSSITEDFQARVRERCEGRPAGEALRELARQLVPLDEQRAREGRVWLAFVARAATDPELAAVHRAGWQELEDLLTALVAATQGRERSTDTDRQDAAALLAVLDGLAVGGLVEPGRLPPNRLGALVDNQLRRLVGCN